MPAPKIRAFLDTNVLLQYIGGKAELQRLFSEEVRARAVFSINGIVLQELLFARNGGGVNGLTAVVPYLEVMGDPSWSEAQAELRELLNRGVHANDVLILAGARSCDVLLTYDKRLIRAGELTSVRSETPEDFLGELGLAA